MRFVLLATLIVACRSSDKPKPAVEQQVAPPSAAAPAAPKPPDDMDEKMRHCPLALDGASSTLEDIDGGVRFTIQVPESALEEVRKRAHHVVELAAKHTRTGHGEFDGKGGGRMRNCPVVTDDVAIIATDIAGGAQLDVTSSDVAQLRTETRARTAKFPFAGATIVVR